MVTVGVLKERGIDVFEKILALPVPVSAAICIVLFLMIGLFGSTAAPKGFIYAQF